MTEEKQHSDKFDAAATVLPVAGIIFSRCFRLFRTVREDFCHQLQSSVSLFILVSVHYFENFSVSRQPVKFLYECYDCVLWGL